ncbi:tryptophan synthase subunit alpha [Candidatus Poribacteria bacterium]|nr:tryptophan synthase subunit alpha [Candidatus Poribacteria bacterium]
MDKITQTLERLKTQNEIGLMTHVVIGYPNLQMTEAIVEVMVEAGTDIVELQMPFSDPTADGPVITKANKIALDNGVKIRDCLEMMRRLNEKFNIPLLFMGYFNLIFNYGYGKGDSYGVAKFCRDAQNAGASGLIVPDIPPDEEQEGYLDACKQNNLHPISVISPNISGARLHKIAQIASGFVYCTSRTGTTGRPEAIAFNWLNAFLTKAKQYISVPLAVGFSLSKREHLDLLQGYADVAVVGSYMMQLFEREGIDGVRQAVRLLKGE